VKATDEWRGEKVTGMARTTRAWLGCLIFLCGLLMVAHGAIASDDYRLQPGDVIHIQVLTPGFETLGTDVLVQPDGKVN